MFIKMGCFGSDYYTHESLKYSSLFDPCSDVLGTGSPGCKRSVCYLCTDCLRDILFCQLRRFDTISINTGDCCKMASVLEICRANMVLFFIHVFSMLYARNCVSAHVSDVEGYPNKIIRYSSF